MPNVFFTLKLTWAAVTNDIRVSVYNVLDQTTPIASVQQNAPHLDQQYDFPGLPRMNFIYKVLECEINGSTVLGQLGQATFVPPNDELIYKSPVDIQIGVTPIEGGSGNWLTGVTNTIPAWIGYELIGGRNGQYPLKKDVDYTWNSTTGTINIISLDAGTFTDGEWFHWEFEPIIQQSSGGVGDGTTTGGAGFSDILLVTTNTVLLPADIGKKILIAPAGNFIQITLAPLTDSPANRITYFEMVDSPAKCCQIITTIGDTLAWIDTEIDICPNESFELYKRIVSAGVFEYRVQNDSPGMKEAGSWLGSDAILTNFNAVLADGAALNYQQYWRLYRRKGIAGILFASWSSLNPFTYQKFSQKDTAGSTFHVPDLITTPVYLRSGGGSDFVPQKLLSHQHEETLGTLPTPPFGQTAGVQHGIIGQYATTGDQHYDLTSRSVTLNTATGLYEIIDGGENNPNSRSTKLYIKT